MHFKADNERQVGRYEGVVLHRLAYFPEKDFFREREAMEYTRLCLDYIRKPVVDSLSFRIKRAEGVHDPFADFHDETVS